MLWAPCSYLGFSAKCKVPREDMPSYKGQSLFNFPQQFFMLAGMMTTIPNDNFWTSWSSKTNFKLNSLTSIPKTLAIWENLSRNDTKANIYISSRSSCSPNTWFISRNMSTLRAFSGALQNRSTHWTLVPEKDNNQWTIPRYRQTS